MIHVFELISEHWADRELDCELRMPDGHTGPVPRGHAFTVALIEALQDAGWEVPHRWATDYSHAFEARGGGDRFDVMVNCKDAEAGAWEVTVGPQTGLLPRLRRRDPAALQRLAGDVRGFLESDEHTSEVRASERDS